MSNSIKIGKKKKTKFQGRAFSGLTQSFRDYGELSAAHRVDQLKERNATAAALRESNSRSQQAADQLIAAMSRTRAAHSGVSGYQPDGSYLDRNGVYQSKAYMDNLQTNKPILEGKGIKGQRCNRTACQAPGAYWYNHSTLKFYCGTCADIINSESRQFKDSYMDGLGHDLLTLDEDFLDKRDERM